MQHTHAAPRGFPEPVYVTRPLLPPLAAYVSLIEGVWQRQQLTNKGPLHDELEEALRHRLQARHLSLVANGTLAILLACRAMELSGDVITTPFTSPATVNAIHWAGLTPVFADVHPLDLTLDPEKVELAITPATSAILGVHVYGHPCDVHALQCIADRHGLRILYDGAHTFGTTVHGEPLVNFGDATALSFHATKLFNTAEGGAAVFRDRRLKDQFDLLRVFGFRDETTVVVPGLNAKMSEVAAALGLANLTVIDKEIAGRAAVAAVYRQRLAGLGGLSFVHPTNASESLFYFMVRIDETAALSRDGLCERLKDFNVFARRYFYPLCSEIPAYSGLKSSSRGNLPAAWRASREVLALPLYSTLGCDGANRVADIICFLLPSSDLLQS